LEQCGSGAFKGSYKAFSAKAQFVTHLNDS
jgi:hypothetical protein